MQQSDATSAELKERLRQRFRSSRPWSGRLITAFCVAATLSEYLLLRQANTPATIMHGLALLAAQIGVNLLADLIGGWSARDGMTNEELATEIADVVQQRLEQGEGMAAVRRLLEHSGALEVALEEWQGTKQEYYKELLAEISALPQLVAQATFRTVEGLLRAYLPAQQERVRRRRIYISTAWEPLDPHRRAVVAYLVARGYEIISEQEAGVAGATGPLAAIAECDLFIGILGHDESAFSESLQPCRELATALNSYRRCLMFRAAKEVPGISLTKPLPPPQPDRPGPPKYQVEPSQPSPCCRGLERWVRNIVSPWLHEPTPDEIDAERRTQYQVDHQAWQDDRSRKQRKYNRQLAQHNEKCRLLEKQHLDAMRVYEQRLNFHRKSLREIADEFPDAFEFRGSQREAVDASLVAQLSRGLEELGKGSRIGFPRQRVLAKWRRWTVDQRQEIKSQFLFDNPADIPSPVESHVDDMFACAWHSEAEAWAVNVVEMTNRILAAEWCNDDIAEQFEPYAFLPVDCHYEPYIAIHRSLSDWIADDAADQRFDVLMAAAATEARKGARTRAEVIRASVNAWRTTCRELAAFLRTRSFGRVLWVMGTSGSGKTHLAARLLKHHELPWEQGVPYCLYLTRPNGAAAASGHLELEEVILQSAGFARIGDTTRIEWNSLDELSNFVAGFDRDGRESKLVIVVDDLELWQGEGQIKLETLLDLIEINTDVHRLYWVVCMAETSRATIVSPLLEQRCRRYGYQVLQGRLESASWQSLDDLNAVKKTWKLILERNRTLIPDPDVFDANLDNIARNLLAIPFVTWIVVDLVAKGDIRPEELRNLNYLGFARRYWEQRLLQASLLTGTKIHGEQWQDWFHRALHLIARIAVERSERNESIELPREVLVDELVAANERHVSSFNSVVVKTVVDTMIAPVGVLGQPTDPRIVGAMGDLVTLRVLPVWWWQAALGLIVELSRHAPPAAEAAEWLAKRFAPGMQETFLQGVLEFLLLLLQEDQAQARDGLPLPAEELRKAVLEQARDLSESYRSVVWLAAAKGERSYQTEFVQQLRQQPAKLEGESDVHNFLYFVRNVDLTEIQNGNDNLIDRLELVRPYFFHLGRFQSGDYFRGLLQRLTDEAETGEQIARVFAHLCGIEPYLGEDGYWSSTDQLAGWTYAILQHRTGYFGGVRPSDAIHAWMIEFLGELCRHFDPPRRDYEAHWTRMLRIHCDYLAMSFDPQLLAEFEMAGWFVEIGDWPEHPLLPAGVSEAARYSMEEQFTTAAGRWYREDASHEQRRTYGDAVEGWTIGSSDRARVAAFLIKHTVPSQGPYRDRLVDDRLWYLFDKLRNHADREVQALMHTGVLESWYQNQVTLRKRYSATTRGRLA
jgi:hypothetical protein